VTSQIEGTQATLIDLFDDEAGFAVNNSDEVEEVSNYLRAFCLVQTSLRDPEGLPISVRLLCNAPRQWPNWASVDCRLAGALAVVARALDVFKWLFEKGSAKAHTHLCGCCWPRANKKPQQSTPIYLSIGVKLFKSTELLFTAKKVVGALTDELSDRRCLSLKMYVVACSFVQRCD